MFTAWAGRGTQEENIVSVSYSSQVFFLTRSQIFYTDKSSMKNKNKDSHDIIARQQFELI